MQRHVVDGVATTGQIADQQLPHVAMGDLESVDQLGWAQLRHSRRGAQRRWRGWPKVPGLVQDAPGGVADVGGVVGASETADAGLVRVVQERLGRQVGEADLLRRERGAHVEQRMLLVAGRDGHGRDCREEFVQLRIVLRRAKHLLVAEELVRSQRRKRRCGHPQSA